MSAGTNASTQAEVDTIRLSAVPHTSVCGQSNPAGAQCSTFITQLNFGIKEVTQEMVLDEG